MVQILSFSRNRHTSVEQVDDTTMRSCCRLQDTLTDAQVEITVKLPDLEIIDVEGKVHRSPGKADHEVVQSLKQVKGVRIGPGMKKIIKGLLGESRIEKQLGFMVLECCDGIILTFTKDVLKKAPEERLKEIAFFEEMVRNNPRLYNSCAALAPGSPLVDGIEE
ncbi:MAG: DUF2889 domain-containing protein [Deltaproteobacteria bacterium]|nr:DUF2889 domain-containing protein [Deltaproteobacteria bacterium]